MTKNRKNNIFVYSICSVLLGYIFFLMYPPTTLTAIIVGIPMLFCFVALLICVFFDNRFSNRGRNSIAEDFKNADTAVKYGLGKCPNCFSEVSRLATKCPHCTADL